jgi:hypothetical protein
VLRSKLLPLLFCAYMACIHAMLVAEGRSREFAAALLDCVGVAGQHGAFLVPTMAQERAQSWSYTRICLQNQPFINVQLLTRTHCQTNYQVRRYCAPGVNRMPFTSTASSDTPMLTFFVHHDVLTVFSSKYSP